MVFATTPERLLTVALSQRSEPERTSTVRERLDRVVFVTARFPESEEISALLSATVPEREERDVAIVRRFPERLLS